MSKMLIFAVSSDKNQLNNNEEMKRFVWRDSEGFLKETRIIVNADWVKKNVLFKDESLYTKKSDYGVMMKWLLSYSVKGRNVHDDVPDGWANFALFVQNKLNRRKTRIMKSPI